MRRIKTDKAAAINGLILLLCIIWGVNWVFMKMGNGYFPPILFSFIRFFIGSLVLLAVCFLQKIPFPDKKELKWHAVCGFLQITCVYAISQQALSEIHVGVVSLLVFTMPLWFAVLAHFFLPGEKLNSQKLAGMLIGITGLFLVLDIRWDWITSGERELAVQIMVLSASVLWALANLMIAMKVKTQDKVQFTTSQMIFGTVGLMICCFLFERKFTVEWNWVSAFSVFFAGAIASALAYVLWFYILSKTEASKSSTSLFLVPVVGVLSSWLFLGETLETNRLLGIILVVLGIVLVTVKKSQKHGKSLPVRNSASKF